MKLKANKILVISLPIIFATTTLVATVGTMVSCSDNKTDNINSVIETKISSSKINDLGSLLSSETSKYTISQFNNYFNGSDSQTRIQNVATSLGIDANVIASIQATGAPTAATITITAASNYKFVLDDTQPSNRNTVVGNIENDGQTIVYNNVSFLNIIEIAQSKISSFGSLLNSSVNNTTIDEFNDSFTNNEASVNITKVADALGIDANVIASIQATGSEENGTITITAASNYKFVLDDTQPSNRNTVVASIGSNGKTIVYNNVSFATIINVSQTKINEFATNLNNQMGQLTIDGFNSYFKGDQASSNINNVASALGINASSIGSVLAAGTYENGTVTGTVTISANNGYKFFQATEELNSVSGNINITNNAIVFSNVIFAHVATITSFANNINLSQQFITKTSNSQITSPAQTTTNATLSNQGLTINITPSQTTNNYFNILLPTNASEVFDLTNTGLADNLTIEWSKPEVTAGTINNDITFENSLGKPFVYNTQSINSGLQTFTLIANIMNGGLTVSNNIVVTFNILVGTTTIDTNNITLDADSLRDTFSLSVYVSNSIINGDISTSKNEINLTYTNPTNNVNTRVGCVYYVLIVNFDILSEVLLNSLSQYGLTKENIGQINWVASNPVGNFVVLEEGNNITNLSKNWNPNNTLQTLGNLIVAANYGGGSFTWNVTFQNLPENIKLSSDSIEFTVNIAFRSF